MQYGFKGIIKYCVLRSYNSAFNSTIILILVSPRLKILRVFIHHLSPEDLPRSSPLENPQWSSISLPRQKMYKGLLPWKILRGLPSLSLARRSTKVFYPGRSFAVFHLSSSPEDLHRSSPPEDPPRSSISLPLLLLPEDT